MQEHATYHGTLRANRSVYDAMRAYWNGSNATQKDNLASAILGAEDALGIVPLNDDTPSERVSRIGAEYMTLEWQARTYAEEKRARRAVAHLQGLLGQF